MENLISAKVTKELKESYAKSKLDSLKTEFETRLSDLKEKQKNEEETLIAKHLKDIEKLKNEYKTKTENFKQKVNAIEMFEFLDPFPTREKKGKIRKESTTKKRERKSGKTFATPEHEYWTKERNEELINLYNIGTGERTISVKMKIYLNNVWDKLNALKVDPNYKGLLDQNKRIDIMTAPALKK